jgi:hypothetical protein
MFSNSFSFSSLFFLVCSSISEFDFDDSFLMFLLFYCLYERDISGFKLLSKVISSFIFSVFLDLSILDLDLRFDIKLLYLSFTV